MKKKILSILIAVFILLPCLLLTGCIGGSPDNVEFRVEDGFIQYTTNGADWQNLIDVDNIKGEKGDTGTAINGREVEFDTTSTHIVWRYKGETEWQELVLLSELKGQDATYTTYTITYDYGVAKSYFKTDQTIDTIKSTEWLITLPEIKDEYKTSFLGWFIAGTGKKIEKYDFVGGNCTLEARFNIEAENCASGLYQNGKYVKTWGEIVEEYPEAFATSGSIIDSGFALYFDDLRGELVIDNSISVIGDSAFSTSRYLTNIILPKSITSIGNGAFSKCVSLTKIQIPYGIKILEQNLFHMCTSLEEVMIPSSVTSILSAFSYCSSLSNIVLPNNLEIIETGAFRDCKKLKEIVIPKSVTSINGLAFMGCGGLVNIEVEEDNSVYDSRENCNAIIETETNTLVVGCKKTIIPNDISIIRYHAFRGCDSLTEIIIPSSVTQIGNLAFDECTALKTIIVDGQLLTQGSLFCNAETIYIKEGLSYTLENFTKQETSDKDGYDMYVRNS